MPAVLFFKSWIRNFVQHVLWKCTLPKLWGASYFSRINVSYEHRFTTTSNVKIHLWEMKIGFGKIWMIRTCRLHEISWGGNKPKRNKTKKRCWMEYIKILTGTANVFANQKWAYEEQHVELSRADEKGKPARQR